MFEAGDMFLLNKLGIKIEGPTDDEAATNRCDIIRPIGLGRSSSPSFRCFPFGDPWYVLARRAKVLASSTGMSSSVNGRIRDC